MQPDLESRVNELERKKASQWLVVLLYFCVLALLLMQLRINANFSQRIESSHRTEASHAR